MSEATRSCTVLFFGKVAGHLIESDEGYPVPQYKRNEEINNRTIQIERIDKHTGNFPIVLGNSYLVAGGALHRAVLPAHAQNWWKKMSFEI